MDNFWINGKPIALLFVKNGHFGTLFQLSSKLENV